MSWASAHVSLTRKRKKQSEKTSFSCYASLYIPHLHKRAPGHSISARGPGSTAQVGSCCPPLPHPSLKELIILYSGSTRTFFPVLLFIRLAILEKAKKTGCCFDLTSNSNRVQGEGSSAHRQAVDAQAVPGCLWEWEVKHPGFVSSGGSWHCSPSLPLLHYVPFYLFAFARLHRLCLAKNVQIMLYFL